MAVPVSLSLWFRSIYFGVTDTEQMYASDVYRNLKASYFVAATQEDLQNYACNVNSPLTLKAVYTETSYEIKVVDMGSDQIISIPDYLFETDYGHYCGFHYE